MDLTFLLENSTTRTVYIVLIIVFALLLLMCYTIAKISELMEFKNYPLAFFPIINLYFVGKMIRTIDIGGRQLKYPQWIAPLIPTLAIFMFFNVKLFHPILLIILYLILAILWLYLWVTFFLTFNCSYKKAHWFGILGSILLLPLPLFIWNVRNNEPDCFPDDPTDGDAAVAKPRKKTKEERVKENRKKRNRNRK